MTFGAPPDGIATAATKKAKRTERRYSVLVALNDEQMAAAEGWRSAHGIADQAEALGELIRLGLLSEIAKIYRLVSDNRMPANGRSRSEGEAAQRKSNPTLQSS